MTFKDIINDEEILNALEAINISEPSEIQSAAIPLMLTGVDLIGQAQTGTGKTFAYGIPTLINTTNKPFETLILCPTRELSIQVSKELKKLLTFKHRIRLQQFMVVNLMKDKLENLRIVLKLLLVHLVE